MPSRLLAALAACGLLGACATPDRIVVRSAPPTGAGAAQALAFMEVQERLEPVAEAECARRNPGADCDFLIVVDDRPGMPPNAFQTLGRGGRPILAVTASLIARAQNADELALVIAHEASHHIAGHLAQLDRTALAGAEAYGRAASAAGATASGVRRAQRAGAQAAVQGYSKQWELEADRLGALVALRAGFDPVRGADFFLHIPDPGTRPGSTHPSNAERIAAVRGAVAY